MGLHPLSMMGELYETTGPQPQKNTSSLYHYVACFFQHVARSLQKLRSRLTVDIVLGEVSGVLEKNPAA